MNNLFMTSQSFDTFSAPWLAAAGRDERFRAAFDEAPMGLALVSLDDRCLYANRQVCGMLGYSEVELRQRRFSSLFDVPAFAADPAIAKTVPAASALPRACVARLVSRAGAELWVKMDAAAVKTACGGGEPCVVVQIQDVTASRRAERLSAGRLDVLEMVARDKPLHDILCRLLQLVEEQSPGTIPSLMLLHNGSLHQVAPHLPADVVNILRKRSVSLAAGLCSHTVGEERKLVVSHIRRDAVWDEIRPFAMPHGLAGCWSLPVRSADQTFVGMLAVFTRDVRPPSAEEADVLEIARHLTVVAVEHFQITRQLAHLARHDPLTGLPNRVLFEDRLQHALNLGRRSRKGAALLALDLDDFKRVNDTFGHAAGDGLLRSLCRRLRDVLRESDTLARVGGDEFMLVLPETGEPDAAAAVAAKILAALATPVAVGGMEISVSLSIGISVCPRDGEDATTLQRRADAALYQAKSLGKNRYAAAA